jgi:hypothetical protein
LAGYDGLVAAEGVAATLGTTEDTGGGRQGARRAAGGSTEGREKGRRVRGLRFGAAPVWKEPKPNQTNTINYLNQIRLLKTSNHLSPIQIGPI